MLKSINKRRFAGRLLSAVICAVLMMAFVPVLAGADCSKGADTKYHVSDSAVSHERSANYIAKKDSNEAAYTAKKDKDEESAVEPDQPKNSSDDPAKEPSKRTSSFNKGFLMLAIGGAVILIAIVALLIRRSNKKAAKETDF